MKRAILLIAGAAALAACSSEIPDSGRGVGYSDYATYEIERARREAALTGAAGAPVSPILPPAGGAAPITAPIPSPSGISSADLSAAGIGPTTPAPALGAPLVTGADPNRTAGVQASPSNAAPLQIASTGISDEQDFDAVADRVSIEDDAARRARQQSVYQVIQPTALPERSGDTGPNLVQYALSTTNRVGQAVYSRSILSTQGRFQRNCAGYRSPDDAQRDFLSRGGPERDPNGIDPDGDGFACGWDPAPFRAAVGRN